MVMVVMPRLPVAGIVPGGATAVSSASLEGQHAADPDQAGGRQQHRQQGGRQLRQAGAAHAADQRRDHQAEDGSQGDRLEDLAAEVKQAEAAGHGDQRAGIQVLEQGKIAHSRAAGGIASYPMET
jgi:hypothetical protein